MHPKQLEHLETVPEKSRLQTERSYKGENSPRAAIKTMCLYCTGYDRKSIKECSAFACPLHTYRPFQSNNQDNE